MVRTILAAVAVAVWALGPVSAEDKPKEEKLTGTLVCGKCKLGEGNFGTGTRSQDKCVLCCAMRTMLQAMENACATA